MALALAAGALTACGSAPRLAEPSGEHRVPVNSEAALAEYLSEAARIDREAQRRTALEAQVRALRKQVAELRAYILLKAAESERHATKGLPADGRSAAGKGAARAGRAPQASAAERVSVSDDGSVMFGTAVSARAASFAPSEPWAGALIAASRLSAAIEIRTPGERPRPRRPGRPSMPDRTQQLVGFLAGHGVPRERIQVVHLPNARPLQRPGAARTAHRAQRVDIVLRGLGLPRDGSANEAAHGT